MKVLIVDDEALARSRLKTLLADCDEPAVEVVAEAADGEQALAELRRTPVDLVLLDIRMPGLDGLALAQALRAAPNCPAIVFVTAHAEHALQAFDLEAADYLTKPVRLERLRQALRKAERIRIAALEPQADSAEKTLLIRERDRTELLLLSDVLYFRAELKYVTVRTAQRGYLLEESLSDLEQQYGADFIRVHRSALVARRAMRALERHYDGEEEGWALRLIGIEDAVPVSRRQLALVREAIAADSAQGVRR